MSTQNEKIAAKRTPQTHRANAENDQTSTGGHALTPPLFQLKAGSGNMPEDVRGQMEGAFQTDFSNVNIHQNSQSATDVGALAYTQGNDVHFAPGQFKPNTSAGQELIGHELTHVVQQREGRVQPTTQAGGMPVNDDKGLENEADVIGRKAAHGKINNHQEALQSKEDKDNKSVIQNKNISRKVIQRFELEGPWNIGDPVHEHITLYSLMKAGLVKKDAKYNAKDVWEYNRGVIWNDDPEGLLFDNNEKENDNWSSGYLWNEHFKGGKKAAKKKKEIGVDDNLTARSHFGDLQFMHAMAQKDGEKASETKSKMMMWAEFTYKVSIGIIAEDVKLKDIPVSGIPALFTNKKVKNLTIRQLFHVHKDGKTKQRAIGSLLHMIQDSFAEGHAEREVKKDGTKGDIIGFHSYVNQDGHKHGEKDGIQPGSKGSMRDKIEKIPGAKDAIKNGALILKLYGEKKSWSEAKTLLETQIFKLKDPNKKAAAGDAFKK